MWDGKKTYIVAEIGGNFTDFETGARLIDDAAEAGADAVKLQTYRADTVSTKNAMFDQENTGKTSQYDYFKKYELSETLHERLFAYAKEKNIDCFSTPSHWSDVEMLERIGNPIYKIGADDATNDPLLERIAGLGKPMILSTGMCTLEECRHAVHVITSTGNRNLAILHTVGNYPTHSEEVNLEVIRTFRKEFRDFVIGYSDHTLGVHSCIFAAVMGARIIEKHFTYDKGADGPDHILSATKEELRIMVDCIREFEVMRGNGIKSPVGNEIIDRSLSRKSLIVAKEIKKGELFTEENLEIKRPGTGIEPENYTKILGRKASKDISADQILNWSDIG